MNILPLSLRVIAAAVIGFCATLQVSYYLTIKRKVYFWINAALCTGLVFGYTFLSEPVTQIAYAVCATLICTIGCYISYHEAHWHKLYSSLIQAFVSVAAIYLAEISSASVELSRQARDILMLLLIIVFNTSWCVIMYIARLRVFTILPEPEENYRKTFYASLAALSALTFLVYGLNVERFAAFPAKFLFIGMLFIIAVLGVLCILYLCVMSNAQMAAEERMLTLKTQNVLMKQYVDNVMEHYNTIHILQHDQKHQLSTLYTFLNAGQPDEAQKHLSLLLNREIFQYQADYCANGVINAVILDTAIRCDHEKILFEPNIQVSEDVLIDVVDLVALLKNAMDNAINCCIGLEDKSRGYLHVSISMLGGYLSFKCINPVDKAPRIRNNVIISTKEDQSQRHGLGIESMQMITRKYDGMLNMDSDGAVFTLAAVLENKSV